MKPLVDASRIRCPLEELELPDEEYKGVCRHCTGAVLVSRDPKTLQLRPGEAWCARCGQRYRVDGTAVAYERSWWNKFAHYAHLHVTSDTARIDGRVLTIVMVTEACTRPEGHEAVAPPPELDLPSTADYCMLAIDADSAEGRRTAKLRRCRHCLAEYWSVDD